MAEGRLTVGPGEYDREVTMVMNATHAKGVVVMVVGGDRGDGFAVQATLGVTLALPKLLREIADQIEADLPDMKAEQ